MKVYTSQRVAPKTTFDAAILVSQEGTAAGCYSPDNRETTVVYMQKCTLDASKPFSVDTLAGLTSDGKAFPLTHVVVDPAKTLEGRSGEGCRYLQAWEP